MKRTFTLLLLFACMSTAFANDEKTIVSAGLKSVTIYRSGAEMTHTAKANLAKGDNELIIEGVSSYVDINSIQVNCPATVTILGVEFSNNYLIPDIITLSLKNYLIQQIKCRPIWKKSTSPSPLLPICWKYSNQTKK